MGKSDAGYSDWPGAGAPGYPEKIVFSFDEQDLHYPEARILEDSENMSFIILTLALPVLAILGVGIYQGVHYWYHPGAPQEEKIGYVDHTGMFGNYTSQPGVQFILYTDEQTAKDALLAKDVKEYLVIPADYLSIGVIARYTMSREVIPSAKTTGQITDFLRSNLLAGEVSPQVLQRVETPLLLTSVRLNETGEIAPNQDVVSTYVVP